MERPTEPNRTLLLPHGGVVGISEFTPMAPGEHAFWGFVPIRDTKGIEQPFDISPPWPLFHRVKLRGDLYDWLDESAPGWGLTHHTTGWSDDLYLQRKVRTNFITLVFAHEEDTFVFELVKSKFGLV